MMKDITTAWWFKLATLLIATQPLKIKRFPKPTVMKDITTGWWFKLATLLIATQPLEIKRFPKLVVMGFPNRL